MAEPLAATRQGARLEHNTLVVTGSIDIGLADDQIKESTPAFALSIADQGLMGLQLSFAKQ